jgi:NAD(P)-dependent dehydrogenase (short-subunit alcohol dehydrogenase family)
MLLKDKVIIISGAGAGLGRVLAMVAAQEGAAIGLGARNGDLLHQIAEEIVAMGGKAIACPTDVTDADQCRKLAAMTQAKFGSIHGLINSAYMPGDWKTADQADPDQLPALFDVSCGGALRMAQACLSALDQSKGAIVNISTMSVVNPFPGEAAYAAAKGGMSALTKHMAADFGRYGIRVNLTRMGWMDSPAVQGLIDSQITAARDRDAVVGEITARIPLGIIPPQEDCARAILFLLSSYARVISRLNPLTEFGPFEPFGV